MARLLTGRFSETPSIARGTLERGWGMPEPRCLIRLVAVFALPLPFGAFGQTDTPLPLIEIPAIEVDRPLSVAELRWCMSQEVWLQAIQPLLGSNDAIDRQNELAIDYNHRCGARHYSREVSEEATTYIEGAKDEIAAAAREDIQQLNNRALTRRIQEMLELLGYELTIDGNYSGQTESAIRSFQLRVDVPADGLISESLLGRLQVEYIRILEGRERSRNSSR